MCAQAGGSFVLTRRSQPQNMFESMYVCMYGHKYSKSEDQAGKVAHPARRGQLNKENEYFPVPVRA